MFYDALTVDLTAGKGGDGCLSFRREKYIPKGGPDGGNGGDGGSIIIECNENEGDLRRYHFDSIWKAETGNTGAGRNKTGRCGKDLVLPFPPGSIFRSEETGEVVAELTEHGQRVVLLNGGKGGKGNLTFKSSTNQAPRKTTPGTLGEAGRFAVELKVIAEVGLVGFPNAGKSSLLGCLTNAHPKTGAYPFTTKDPSVGFMSDESGYRRLRIADIPGLIEGASENRGLGHRFLKHVERCKMLVILIDIAAVDGRDPNKDHAQLLKELKLYSKELVGKPQLVVLNKVDLLDSRAPVTRFNRRLDEPALEISCSTGQGLKELSARLFLELDRLNTLNG